jgi:hypothetical protein
MRLTQPLLGLVLGVFAGGLVLEAGILVLLLVLPALVWAAREPRRPLGLAGFVAGIGVGIGGLLAWAVAQCAADPSCSMPGDPTPWFVLAATLIVAGALLAVAGARRQARTKA